MALAAYLQREFARLSPDGWCCGREVPLLPPDLEELLGYAPRADVLLESRDGRSRLWIEFEVSRADPVANHAKFATAHIFRPQTESDAFLAMVSPHVARGRRNLAANMVLLMRQLGMNAYQTPLFPLASPEEVKRLNHLDLSRLERESPPVEPEIERALAVSRPVLALPGRRIHFAGELMEVMMNLRRWNEEVATPEGARVWGRRTVTYFVFAPRLGSFAPSKFCAYVPIVPPEARDGRTLSLPAGPRMTVELYATLDHSSGPFDGAQARIHLTRRLGMALADARDSPDTLAAFDRWLARHRESITVHPSGPLFISPPPWFG